MIDEQSSASGHDYDSDHSAIGAGDSSDRRDARDRRDSICEAARCAHVPRETLRSRFFLYIDNQSKKHIYNITVSTNTPIQYGIYCHNVYNYIHIHKYIHTCNQMDNL